MTSVLLSFSPYEEDLLRKLLGPTTFFDTEKFVDQVVVRYDIRDIDEAAVASVLDELLYKVFKGIKSED